MTKRGVYGTRSRAGIISRQRRSGPLLKRVHHIFSAITASVSALLLSFVAQFHVFMVIWNVWNEHSVKTVFVAFDMMAFFDDPGKEEILSVHRRATQASDLAIHHSLRSRYLLYSTSVEAQILVDIFKHLPKCLSIIMKPIGMTSTPIPLVPSKSVENSDKFPIPWQHGVPKPMLASLEEAHSIGFHPRYGLEEQLPTLRSLRF